MLRYEINICENCEQNTSESEEKKEKKTESCTNDSPACIVNWTPLISVGTFVVVHTTIDRARATCIKQNRNL